MGSLLQGTPAPLSWSAVALNLALVAVLSFMLALHFVRFGTTLANRRKFAHILPAIALTTALVISVVKASLALSLGLVGALSIVRFRTPIKEPEELAYLFMAIAIGLGMGADQRVVTVIAMGIILGILAVRALLSGNRRRPNIYLNVELPEGSDQEDLMQGLLEALLQHVPVVDVRRIDVRDGRVEATVYLECDSPDTFIGVQKELTKRYPDSALTFIEQSVAPGV